MKYIMYWDIPVEKRRDANLAYSEIVRGGVDGLQVELYWIADSSDGKYHGIGILEAESGEAIYKLFGALQDVAEVQLVPAVGGEQLLELWQKELTDTTY